MIPIIEQLLGTWISQDKHPQHLQEYGYQLKLHIDQLPFDNFSFGKVYALDKTLSGKKIKETQLHTGRLTIDNGKVKNEFFIVIEDLRLPAFDFDGNSFVAAIPHYGNALFIKE